MNKEVFASVNEQGDVVRARRDGASINVIDGMGASGLESNDSNLGVDPSKNAATHSSCNRSVELDCRVLTQCE